MDIEGPKPIKAVSTDNSAENVTYSNQTTTPQKPSAQTVDVRTRQALDKATGLLQSITSHGLSDKVIRKMPPDEYLKMVSLLDHIVSGSVDNQV